MKDLRPGETVDQVFLIQGKDLRRNAAGALYAACRLCDKSGVIDARWWQATEERFAAIADGAFVKVSGRVQSHRGQIQLIIDDIEAVELAETELRDFLPSTERDIEAMWAELVDHLGGISNAHLRRLVDKFVGDEALVAKLKSSPAATQIHHNTVGGLLEHTLDIVRLARAITSVYGDALNRDLLLVGAFLHDLGKTEELEVEGAFSYTDRGNLVGHIASAVIWIEQKADAISEERGEPFPDQIRDLVQHMVLSHHGAKERGSPKVPMIPEALVLHAIDDLDMRVHVAREAIETDQDPSSSFTPYHRILDARLYKRSTVLPGDGDPE